MFLIPKAETPWLTLSVHGNAGFWGYPFAYQPSNPWQPNQQALDSVVKKIKSKFGAHDLRHGCRHAYYFSIHQYILQNCTPLFIGIHNMILIVQELFKANKNEGKLFQDFWLNFGTEMGLYRRHFYVIRPHRSEKS